MAGIEPLISSMVLLNTHAYLLPLGVGIYFTGITLGIFWIEHFLICLS